MAPYKVDIEIYLVNRHSHVFLAMCSELWLRVVCAVHVMSTVDVMAFHSTRELKQIIYAFDCLIKSYYRECYSIESECVRTERLSVHRRNLLYAANIINER